MRWILDTPGKGLRRLRGDDGSVLPVTLGALLIALTFAGVATQASNVAGNQSSEDRQIKRAVQAADAGLSAAVYQMNKLDVSRAPAEQRCVRSVSGVLSRTNYPVGSPNWCDPVTEDLGDGASYTYRASSETALAAPGTFRRTIVSTGTAGGETRRVAATVNARRPVPLFRPGEAVFSDRDLQMDSNSRIVGNAGSNEDIILLSNSQVCGNATPGPGHGLSGSGQVCPGYTTSPASTPFILPPVSFDGSGVDGNARLGCGGGGDVCTNPSEIAWDSTTRRLHLNGAATITLGGGVYSLCQLVVDSNAQIIIPPRPSWSPARIYFDAPENCSTSGSTPSLMTPPGRGGMLFNSNTRIVNQSGQPADLQIFMSGSPTIPTVAEFNSNFMATEVAVTIYAPRSLVDFNSNAQFRGAISAQQVRFDSNTIVTWDDSALNAMTDAIFPLLTRADFRECESVAAPPADPSSGC